MPSSSSRSRPSSIPMYPTAKTIAGQRRQVYLGKARKTRGGLTKADLKVNPKTGRVVSRRASSVAKRDYSRRGLRAHRFRASPFLP